MFKWLYFDQVEKEHGIFFLEKVKDINVPTYFMTTSADTTFFKFKIISKCD